MKAVIAGSLAEGFALLAIVEYQAARTMVDHHLSRGQLAEVMEIIDPAMLDQNATRDEEGAFLVCYGTSMGGGFELFGPFGDSETAEEFAEANRAEDDEWEILELDKDAGSIADDPRLFIEELGYDIDRDSDQPGKWIWTAPTDGCDTSFDTSKLALDAAWMDAVAQTMGALNLSSENWDALSFQQQSALIRESLTGS